MYMCACQAGLHADGQCGCGVIMLGCGGPLLVSAVSPVWLGWQAGRSAQKKAAVSGTRTLTRPSQSSPALRGAPAGTRASHGRHRVVKGGRGEGEAAGGCGVGERLHMGDG
jgi:hypothetical protein